MRLIIQNPHLLANLAHAKTIPPHNLKIQTQLGEYSAKIRFTKKYENYTRIEGIIFFDSFKERSRRFSLNLINGAKIAEIDLNIPVFWIDK